MIHPAPISADPARLPPLPPAQPQPPRAIGMARLGAGVSGGASAIADLRQQGCLKLLFPRHDGPGLTAMAVNTAGGITGGDRIELRATARAGARLTLTTQAAERLYAARPGETGRVSTQLSAGPGARIDWLPQETILFNRASVQRELTVELAPGASFLGCEALVLGRPAMGERLSEASLTDRIRLVQDGALLWTDCLRLSGDVAALTARPGIAGGAGAMASLIYLAADAAQRLDPLRAAFEASLPGRAGASLLRPGLLLARVLAPDSFLLRRALAPVLETLHGAALPRSWNL